jgi:hypothetical protein
MFNGTYDRAARAERNRAVAAEPPDPIPSHYLRIAKDHLVRSQDDLRALERENLASIADGPAAPPPSSEIERAPKRDGGPLWLALLDRSAGR